MGRYNWGDENQTTQGLNRTGSKILTNYEQYTASNTRTFTPHLVSEARFGYSRFYNSIGTRLAFDTDVVSEIGIPGQKAGLRSPGEFRASGLAEPGSPGSATTPERPYANDNNTLQLTEKLSWIRGKHALRLRSTTGKTTTRSATSSRAGVYIQPNTTRALPDRRALFAEFLLGNIFTSTNAVAIANARFQRNVEHAFVDDTWRLTSKLTLSLGLRYELTPPLPIRSGTISPWPYRKLSFVGGLPESDWPYFVRQGGNCAGSISGPEYPLDQHESGLRRRQ